VSELRELYQEVILDHSKHPRNLRAIEDARHAEGNNPLCGDIATIYVKLKGDVIEDASFVGRGCSISTASASMMTESLKGKTRKEAEALFQKFHRMLTEDGSDPDRQSLGKLVVFSGVREFPVRVKCATLAWHTLRAALENLPEVATTE
jgi:nitrogen fixation protein NifU and related proteins